MKGAMTPNVDMSGSTSLLRIFVLSFIEEVLAMLNEFRQKKHSIVRSKPKIFNRRIWKRVKHCWLLSPKSIILSNQVQISVEVGLYDQLMLQCSPKDLFTDIIWSVFNRRLLWNSVKVSFSDGEFRTITWSSTPSQKNLWNESEGELNHV